MNFSLPLLDDQPAQVDYLNFESYVTTLYNVITHEETNTPLTLGIYGQWGIGKTTLMHNLRNKLRSEKISTIWFNAWRYNNTDALWSAFLQSVLNNIDNELSLWRKTIFKGKLFFKRIKPDKLFYGILKYLVTLLFIVVTYLLIEPISNELPPGFLPYIEVGGTYAGIGLIIWLFILPLSKASQDILAIDFDTFRQKSNYREHIEFLDRFREHFQDVIDSLPKRKLNKRLVVFIDDLDRCSPTSVIQVLDAIKLFADISGCVYILGLDSEVVQKAIAHKYGEDRATQKEYLNKIIQVPFLIPPIAKESISKLVNELTSPKESIGSRELNEIRKQQRLPWYCQTIFVVGLPPNPRIVKRTINIYSLLWKLAEIQNENTKSVPTQTENKNENESQKENRQDKFRFTQARLAKVVVIQHRYPELHRLLEQHSFCLNDFEKYI